MAGMMVKTAIAIDLGAIFLRLKAGDPGTI